MTVFIFTVFVTFTAGYFYPISRILGLTGHGSTLLSFLIAFGLVATFFITIVFNNVMYKPWIGEFTRWQYTLLGFVLLAVPLVLAYDLIGLALDGYKMSTSSTQLDKVLLHYRSPQAGWVILGLVALLGLKAIYNFYQPIGIDHVTIRSDKVTESYTLLHISDLQLGTVSKTHVLKVQELINRLDKTHDFDLILNTGDQIDSDGYHDDDLVPLSPSQTNDIPQIFSLGNHEFIHDTSRILANLKRLDIQVLRQNHLVYEELNIIAADDKRTDYLNKLQKHLDPMKYNILLYHRPDVPKSLGRQGVNLLLAGHTHGGQIWPYSLGLKLLYPIGQGVGEYYGMTTYVTDGLALWGPRMRLGTQNQLAVIQIIPE